MTESAQVDEYVPIEERCYRGCRRRGVVRDGIAVYCASCFLTLIRKVSSHIRATFVE